MERSSAISALVFRPLCRGVTRTDASSGVTSVCYVVVFVLLSQQGNFCAGHQGGNNAWLCFGTCYASPGRGLLFCVVWRNGKMPVRTLTLIVSREGSPAAGLALLQSAFWQPEQVHLFCLGPGTRLVTEDFSAWPPGERVYCAHMHQKLAAPPPAVGSPFVAAGLATLGRLIRDSQMTLTLAHPHWPPEPAQWGVKQIGILLGEEPDMQLEALRLATGLAGCNHHITVHTPHEPLQLRALLPEAGPFFQVLAALKAEFDRSFPKRARQHSVLLQL
jgi:hypothetical protein